MPEFNYIVNILMKNISTSPQNLLLIFYQSVQSRGSVYKQLITQTQGDKHGNDKQ